MPISRDLAADLIETLAQLYLDSSAALVLRTASALRRGIDEPDWVAQKQAGARELEFALRKILRSLGRQTSGKLAAQITAAYELGGQAAAEEIAAHLSGEAAARAATSLPQSAAIQRLIISQVAKLEGTHLPVLRSVMDAYREAIAAGGAGDVLTGVSTRREATQRAWSRLLDKGITSFSDVRGRRWNLAGYAEMSMRTTTAHAAVEGHLDKLSSLDLDLVIVSNSAQECKLCRPWEGKILSRSGGARTVLAENPATGENVAVDVAGSVDEAVRAGLFHPQCRHSLSAYFPGLTEVPTNTADPEGDAERQRLRALERRVRRLRTQEAGALDGKAREHYGKLADKAQGDIREFVKGKKNLMRKPERERIDLGHKRAAPVAVAPPKKPIKRKSPSTTASPTPKKATASAEPKPAPLGPEELAAAHNKKLGNPAELTGSGRHWSEAIPHDTGPDFPIPVKDLAIFDDYTVNSGKAWRVDGVTYLVEDMRSAVVLSPKKVFEQFFDAHSSLPGASRYQKGYAWLERRNPDDAYWEKKYNREGFTSLATAGDGRVYVWGRQADVKGPHDIARTTLAHEFGHNVSHAARRLGLDDASLRWRQAVALDGSPLTPMSWKDAPGGRPIGWGRWDGRAVPQGITEYGASAPAEDYAETMRLFLRGPIGTGRLMRNGVRGPLVDIYLRDLWPERARLFDELFPEIAERQRKAIAARAE